MVNFRLRAVNRTLDFYERNSRKLWFTYCLVALGLIFVIIPLWGYFGRSQIRRQTNNTTIDVLGVFCPGQYVKVVWDTGLDSVEGYFEGQLTVYPRLSEGLQDEGVEWYVPLRKYRSDWGDTIRKLNASIGIDRLKFSTELRIPDEPRLEGETVRLELNLFGSYPASINGAFVNKFIDLDESVEIVIDQTIGSPVGFWDQYPHQIGEFTPARVIWCTLMLAGAVLVGLFVCSIPRDPEGWAIIVFLAVIVALAYILSFWLK